MSDRTVRVQIESPLSHVKARIDEIHAVIEKHKFVKPMVADAGIRKPLLSNAILNADRIENVLRTAVLNGHAPPVPVSPIPVIDRRRSPPTLARNEAKLSVAAQREAQARLERRKYNHRNCCPPGQRNSTPPVSVATMVDADLPARPVGTIATTQTASSRSRTVVELRNNQFDGKNEQIENSQKRPGRIVLLDPTAVDAPPAETIDREPDPKSSVAELEKLIRDTDELLSAEGISADVNDASLSDIEREIEQLTSVSLRKTDPRVAQLERDLNNLIQQHL